MGDYWKDQEVQKDFKTWMSEYEGCLMCDCGHGCADWISKNRAKTALILRILNKKNATTSLDKLAKMPLERADRIWHAITWKECIEANRQLRESEKELKKD